MARPLKNAADRKSVDVRIPLTEEQKKIVTEAALAEQTDVAAWARPILLAAAIEKMKRKGRAR